MMNVLVRKLVAHLVLLLTVLTISTPAFASVNSCPEDLEYVYFGTDGIEQPIFKVRVKIRDGNVSYIVREELNCIWSPEMPMYTDASGKQIIPAAAIHFRPELISEALTHVYLYDAMGQKDADRYVNRHVGHHDYVGNSPRDPNYPTTKTISGNNFHCYVGTPPGDLTCEILSLSTKSARVIVMCNGPGGRKCHTKLTMGYGIVVVVNWQSAVMEPTERIIEAFDITMGVDAFVRDKIVPEK
ncbi:hypothetical protein F9L33_14450 [Amylibacter sp. SFDW26]|uniref:hypothetical protein n=1 Tax=Amylibacter sp. SFDW26 TaxID=2652722 RepID=UPI0012613F12|nr:hypothetical protein [Amylibacter sp. SFDW26]KAB7610496.1 hypothetical protein F9L33_14450 [Amylibacter sp. SFDW26]